MENSGVGGCSAEPTPKVAAKYRHSLQHSRGYLMKLTYSEKIIPTPYEKRAQDIGCFVLTSEAKMHWTLDLRQHIPKGWLKTKPFLSHTHTLSLSFSPGSFALFIDKGDSEVNVADQDQVPSLFFHDSSLYLHSWGSIQTSLCFHLSHLRDLGRAG